MENQTSSSQEDKDLAEIEEKLRITDPEIFGHKF